MSYYNIVPEVILTGFAFTWIVFVSSKQQVHSSDIVQEHTPPVW